MFAMARRLVHLFQGAVQYLRTGQKAGGRKTTVHGFRLCHVGIVLGGLTLGGCSSVPGDRSGVLDRTLYALGLQRADAISLQAPSGSSAQAPQTSPQRVVLRLHAGQLLNTSAQGQSLSVVVRLYRLRERSAFERAPYAAFQKSDADHHPELSADILESRELLLTPGQRYEAVETLGTDVRYFAVVVLFRHPDQQRWRFIFDAKTAADTGITLGLHGCAVSVAAGQPLDVPVELMRVAGVRCESPPG